VGTSRSRPSDTLENHPKEDLVGRNVEVKARVEDPDDLRRRVESVAGGPAGVLEQRDVFFHVPEGRIKLRVFPDGRGELIAYRRADRSAPSLSDYRIHRTDNPVGLESFLRDLLGVRGEVCKTRRLYHLGQTRVHLDEVDRLGSFLELEVVLDDDQTEEEGARIASRILAELRIPDADRVACAYVDLLEATR
jgi:predicted adenylyl cyclase CyaB